MKANDLMVGDIVLRKGKPVEIVSTSGSKLASPIIVTIRQCSNTFGIALAAPIILHSSLLT